MSPVSGRLAYTDPATQIADNTIPALRNLDKLNAAAPLKTLGTYRVTCAKKAELSCVA
jgi:hypothetical protein